MPLTHVPTSLVRTVPAPREEPLLSPTSVPAPANIHALAWLMAPAHFLLALAMLRPLYQSWPLSLTAALVTTLLASRPVSLGTRTVDRRSLMHVVVSMLGLGYVNTLLSAAFVLGVATTPDLWPIAAAIGLPVALFFTLPFMVLDLPLVGAVQALDGPARYDSRDELLCKVGLHGLAVSALMLFIVSAFWPSFAREPVGLLSTVLAGAGGLTLVARSAVRMQRREAFVASVLRGEVPGYDVEPLEDAAPPPALSREADLRFAEEPNALFFVEAGPADGVYRTGRQRIPVARV